MPYQVYDILDDVLDLKKSQKNYFYDKIEKHKLKKRNNLGATY